MIRKSNKLIKAIALSMVSVFLIACSEQNLTSQNVPETPAFVETVEETASTLAEEPEVTEEAENAETEEIVPILKDGVEKSLGCFIGCSATGSEFDDENVWNIITTHFNAITFGNELKPDALFNYSNGLCPGVETVEFNGETMEVPVLNFSRAEKALDKVKAWNDANPDNIIKVRGHVLVWHSQTPEWFFHEGYDKNKDYVSKETMNKRLEWYISSVLTHFTGEDSKYKGMFYGWDVVNEAMSDGQGGVDGLRCDAEDASEPLSKDTHGSNSSWYHIYQSNEYIINAFTYANKYAPADLELYYNDYNECQAIKRTNIIKLLKAIKEKEGEPGVGTRISAMGMQGHYQMGNPDFSTVAASIALYTDAVGAVQITELDIATDTDFNSSAELTQAEDEKLTKRYKMLKYGITTAINQGGNLEGITFWGTVDKYSWLQGTHTNKQMPLLFDDNYEPKDSFYVFATDGQ